jgi:translation initiation factor 1 (eIF-1/SUI1)
MKKKFLTTIWGLVANKINAKAMSKKCAKKFACSCSVVDEDRIQIQGDVSEELYEFLEAEFKIKDKNIITAE